MEQSDNKERREEVFSKAIRAGKRTYFFDVKATRSDEYYITVTESKRRFNNEQGKFFYEKHKIFLYKEDFEKFANGLRDVVKFIETGEIPVVDEVEERSNLRDQGSVEFEDLMSETEDEEVESNK
ncbi:MAG: DNA-binding protein [Bacteroidetes bacterium HGW-Bacteroidetes-17]|jgi:hypothetical protein|nr:MAG: DNA-binding protein [Bacteroidetes bacterium HGW-Bacteroidetes-17]